MKRIDIIRQKIRQKLNERSDYQEEQYKIRQAKWQKYYNTPIWEGLRNMKYSNTPVCECCYKWKGIVQQAEEIHHAQPYGTGINEQQKWELFTDYTNLVSLCKNCHKLVHKLMNKYHRIIDPRYINIFEYDKNKDIND